MKSNSTFRSAMLATLMVLVTAAIGLQPLVFSSGSGCICEAKVSANADASADELPCCNGLAEVQVQTGCCSPTSAVRHLTPAMSNECCCNPAAALCECNDCGCSEDSDSNSSLPAIPTNETTEVVTPTLICSALFVGHPRESKIKRDNYPSTVAEYAALSSQQTCILLSRFTC